MTPTRMCHRAGGRGLLSTFFLASFSSLGKSSRNDALPRRISALHCATTARFLSLCTASAFCSRRRPLSVVGTPRRPSHAPREGEPRVVSAVESATWRGGRATSELKGKVEAGETRAHLSERVHEVFHLLEERFERVGGSLFPLRVLLVVRVRRVPAAVDPLSGASVEERRRTVATLA
jgi:hypothetical protein